MYIVFIEHHRDGSHNELVHFPGAEADLERTVNQGFNDFLVLTHRFDGMCTTCEDVTRG